MKRVINGVSYNTDTARVVAKWEYTDQDGYETEATLYQTRGRAFFAVHEWDVKVEDRWSDRLAPRHKVYFEEMTWEEVQRLVERTDNLEILAPGVLEEPPEAEAEETPGATLYIRVPASLKSQIEAAASEDKLSVNAWMMRCAERCLAKKQGD